MCSHQNKKLSDNDLLLSKAFETLPLYKKTSEQQDNESLNTMDYYKEENSSRNQKIDENNLFFSKKLSNQNKKINSIRNTNLSFVINKNKSNKNTINLYENIDIERTKPFFVNKNEKNVLKRFEDMKVDNDYCSRCNSEIEYITKVCRHCLKPLCRKCLKLIFNRNLDNNDDIDNFDQNLINEKICPNCRNLNTINDFIISKAKTLNKTISTFKEPLDTELDDTSSTQYKEEQNSVLLKDLEEQFNEYDFLVQKIEEKKKEIEIKKKININILNMIQKSIENEYDTNLKKLNEISFKLKKLRNTINDKNNKIKRETNYNNSSDLQNLIRKFRNTINAFSKHYEKLEQKISTKSKPKAYKFYESKSLNVNIADTYNMKNTEVISNQYIGKASIKIQRFINNYVNYLNFSVLVQKDNKNMENNNKNKSILFVHMVINNQLIQLFKTNKDNNKLSLNYECSLEESKAFLSKSHANKNKDYIKKDEFDVKLIITELFL